MEEVVQNQPKECFVLLFEWLLMLSLLVRPKVITLIGFHYLSIFSFSCTSTPQRCSPTSSKNDFYVWPNTETRTWIPEKRVHLSTTEIRTCRISGSDWNSDQNLVSESSSQRQEDWEGSAWSPVQVNFTALVWCRAGVSRALLQNVEKNWLNSPCFFK